MLRDPVVWLLVAAAFVLRLAYNLALHPDGHSASSYIIDEREYFGAAHMLASGRGFTFFDTAMWVRPPLYVLLLASVFVTAGNSYLPVLVVQSLISAITLLPLAWLAYRIAGRAAALWAAVIGMLYLPFTLFTGLLLSETLFLCLFAFATVLLVLARDGVTSTGMRRALPWLVLSGLLTGLAVETRATALGFVPVAMLWLFFAREPGERSSWRSGLTAGLVLLAVVGVVMLPWLVRNFRAYGKPVLVDTTSGYNLWLASIGVRDEERLQADLRTLTGPVERQEYALSRGVENILADPVKFVSKGMKESLDLWTPLFSAEERQVSGYTLGRVPSWHLVALLLLDDVLYIVILLSALLSLLAFGPHRLRALTVGWILFWVLTAFVFFAVTRFRLPIVAALIPWAGAALGTIFQRDRLAAAFHDMTRGARILSAAATIAILVVAVPAVEADEIALGVQRWVQQQPFRQAEALLRAGDPRAAQAEYRRANMDLFDTRYGLAAALLGLNDIDGALAQLRTDEPGGRFEPAIIRGQAARINGDTQASRAFFSAREVQVAGDEALLWAWDHLQPNVVASLDIGSGLDVGYVRGFYGPETDDSGVAYRWSGPSAEVRLLAPQPDAQVTWSGWRPDAVSAAEIVLSADPAAPHRASLSRDPGWREQQINLAAGGKDGAQDGVIVKFDANAFVAGGNDPRLLGVRVSRIGAGR